MMTVFWILALALHVSASDVPDDIVKKVDNILHITKGQFDREWLMKQQTAMAALRRHSSKQTRSKTTVNPEDEKFLEEAQKFYAPPNNFSSKGEQNEGLEDFTYQGDIILSPEQIYEKIGKQNSRAKRVATINPKYYWSTSEPIKYYVLPEVDATVIRAATKLLQDNTCLNFQESSSDITTGNGIRYYQGSGCNSPLRKNQNGVPQNISLAKGCQIMAIVCHETMHSLGFAHTQERSDRDDFVVVNYTNIPENQKANFDKATDVTNSGLSYDYASVMHYGPYAFGIDGNYTTIAPKQLNYLQTIGQRYNVSFTDLLEINLLYKCAEKCKNTVPCQNGGFINSKTCDSCICPKYFSGKFCENFATSTAPKCNGEHRQLEASENYSNIKLSAGTNSKLAYFQSCQDSITCPVGKKVQFEIVNLYADCYSTCPYGSYEFNTGAVQYEGFRVCCPNQLNRTYTTTSNRLLVYGATSLSDRPNMEYKARCV